ncbi:MAG TPA: HD domain-containing phosphohydrolase, partial [Candidatus Hypogeohydataceae bacterium YC38]
MEAPKSKEEVLKIAKALSRDSEKQHPHLQGHSDAVERYAVKIARALKLPKDFIFWLSCACYLHDVGNMRIPEEILNKPGRLDPVEWSTIQSHPLLSVDIITPSITGFPEIHDIIIPIVMHHHERFDGTGYPSKLKGNAIPIGARILAAAELYDALTSIRPYRPAFSKEAALDALRDEKGKMLDPEISDILLEIMTTEVSKSKEEVVRIAEDLSKNSEKRYPFLVGHCDKVEDYAVKIAKVLELPEDFIFWLSCACYLHDVGNMGVPEGIMNKPGSLDYLEWNVIRNHPLLSVAVITSSIAGSSDIHDIVIPIVMHHHERFDGTGYPSKLKGKNIPIGARILAAAELYDALTNIRPYRSAFSREAALK